MSSHISWFADISQVADSLLERLAKRIQRSGAGIHLVRSVTLEVASSSLVGPAKEIKGLGSLPKPFLNRPYECLSSIWQLHAVCHGSQTVLLPLSAFFLRTSPRQVNRIIWLDAMIIRAGWWEWDKDNVGSGRSAIGARSRFAFDNSWIQVPKFKCSKWDRISLSEQSEKV